MFEFIKISSCLLFESTKASMSSFYNKITNLFFLWNKAVFASLSIFVFFNAVIGCGSSNMSSSSSTTSSSSSTSSSLNAAFTPASISISYKESALVKWTSQQARAIEMEGEEGHSEDFSGYISITPQQDTMYFLSAVNGSDIVSTQLNVHVNVASDQLPSLHSTWLNGIGSSLATLNCTNSNIQQQSSESNDAVLTRALANNTSCIILTPQSTSPTIAYFEGFAADNNGSSVYYISDSSQPQFQ
jgi:hypothetical protein